MMEKIKGLEPKLAKDIIQKLEHDLELERKRNNSLKQTNSSLAKMIRASSDEIYKSYEREELLTKKIHQRFKLDITLAIASLLMFITLVTIQILGLQ